jgi:hypothetical protein
MNVAHELKVLRLGQPPEMRFKTGEEESAPVFIMRVLTGAEELEAAVNTRKYLEQHPDQVAAADLIAQTEVLAIAMKDAEGKRLFMNGSHLRSRYTDEQIGALRALYQGLKVHHKTLGTISDDELKTLVEGVVEGKLREST